MPRRGQRQQGARRTTPPRNGKRHLDNEGIVPVLARAVREVENAVQRGSVMSSVRTKFQVVALIAREERARVKADPKLTDSQRDTEVKRLEGIATILAKTAARDPSLFDLLQEDATISESARLLRREMLEAAGIEVPPERTEASETPAPAERRVVPQSVISRQLANPFLAPDFTAAPPLRTRVERLAGWELIGPLLRSFEQADAGASACMALPDPASLAASGGKRLMRHQAQVVESAAAGHRTFLLADEPGLGKTAQALLSAQAADAYPLLVVVPNVVKANWAREAGLWTPRHPATVVHGDGDTMDGFADIVVVNYDILDRHVGWLGDLGFKGMVIDEAHFIKNKSSQRSQHVLHLADRIRSRSARPLLMALTGTPLINDIEDFRAIWQFLGWIDAKMPRGQLMAALEATGATPLDASFYPAARRAVVDLGIVRRRKADVAADIPARRIADLPVELDDAAARSIRHAEQELTRRLVARYESALATRSSGGAVETPDGIDHELIRRVAAWEREDTSTTTGENVFGMMRRIGQAKAGLAADYAAQLARSVGKVVFFAKHIDVMDTAEELFAQRGITYASIRGDQTSRVRQRNIDAFVEDPEVAVVVCSLTAAGVGINLQVASDLVLAELSWTDAEQTQAIDRVHRIGQSEPVTAWRIIAAQTLDTRIAEVIDAKAGLAARALDGAGEQVSVSADVQVEALVSLLTTALTQRLPRRSGPSQDARLRDGYAMAVQPIPESAEVLRRLAASDDDQGLAQQLSEVAHLVQQLVPSLVGLSLGMRYEELTLTVVASDVAAAAFDALQYLDGGPCVTVAEVGEPVLFHPDGVGSDRPTVDGSIGVATDGAADPGPDGQRPDADARAWRLLCERQQAEGVLSTLSLPVGQDGASATLNLYASARDAFEGRVEELAGLLGAVPEEVLLDADLRFASRLRAAAGPAQLDERDEIDRAAGVFAAARGTSVLQAHERLRETAAASGIRVLHLARLVLAGYGDERPPPG